MDKDAHGIFAKDENSIDWALVVLLYYPSRLSGASDIERI